MLIAFSKLACSRCGDRDHIVGTDCSVCGRPARSTEIDHHVVRRRQAVRRIRDAIAVQPVSLDFSRTPFKTLPDLRSGLSIGALAMLYSIEVGDATDFDETRFAEGLARVTPYEVSSSATLLQRGVLFDSPVAWMADDPMALP